MTSTELKSELHGQNEFRWKDADAYLFDIDGTLIVTRDLVHWNALHQAMREAYDVNATIEGIPYHGKTDLGILRAALERAGIRGADFETKLPRALEVVGREVTANASRIVADVCPAIPGLLATLRSRGKLLGVASGNLQSVGWQKIEAAGLREFFSFGCFSNECEMRSEIFRHAVAEANGRLGRTAKVCFIGDTPEDIRAARQAKATIIAVSTGTYRMEELNALMPDLCISSCAELI